MQVILLEKVANLGNLGEVVRVRDGYARNYLLPKKIARRATEAALKEFEERRAALVQAGFTTIDKSQIRLPDGHLKAVGEFPVQVVLHADVTSEITVCVQGQMV